MISTIEFILSDVCTNHFVKLDKPSRKMLASICETQCMIVCHETEGNYEPGSTMNIWESALIFRLLVKLTFGCFLYDN